MSQPHRLRPRERTAGTRLMTYDEAAQDNIFTHK